MGKASTLPIFNDVVNEGEDSGEENGVGGAGGGERTEGERTVVWHDGPEGFSTYVFSFACALSFAHATNRTLLIAPLNPTHVGDHFKYPDLYMDELLQVPSRLRSVSIKHLSPEFPPPQHSVVHCGCVRWSKTRPMVFRVYARRSGVHARRHDSAAVGKQLDHTSASSFDKVTFEGKSACRNPVCGRRSTSDWKKFVATSVHRDVARPHVQIASRFFPSCKYDVPFVSSPKLRQNRHRIFDRSPPLSGRQIWGIHLRRGDRCERPGKPDRKLLGIHTSGACTDPVAWVEHLVKLREQDGAASKISIYVATDEKDQAQLARIQRAGALIFSDIQKHAPLASEHGEFGIFLTELDLLIHANRTFAPQKMITSVMDVVKSSRKALQLPDVERLNESGAVMRGSRAERKEREDVDSEEVPT